MRPSFPYTYKDNATNLPPFQMDTLSKTRRYLEANPSVLTLSPVALEYALHVYYVRRNRCRLAELLCALISDAIGAKFGLGDGAKWFAEGAELMEEMLGNFLDADLLNDEEKDRGRCAVVQPHTAGSLLELLARTNAAITKRRDNRALKLHEQRQALAIAA